MSRVKKSEAKNEYGHPLSVGWEKMNIQVKKTSVLENQQMFNDGMKYAIEKQAATKMTTD